MCPLFSPVCADVTVTFSTQNYTVIEGDPAPLMIILDKPAAKDITVAVTTMDITATGGQAKCSCSKWVISLLEPNWQNSLYFVSFMHVLWLLLPSSSDTDDYIGGSFDVSIPAGSVKVTLNMSTLRDSIVEPAEYFKATLSLPGAPEGCIVGTPNMSYITIIDDSRMLGLGEHALLKNEL